MLKFHFGLESEINGGCDLCLDYNAVELVDACVAYLSLRRLRFVCVVEQNGVYTWVCI